MPGFSKNQNIMETIFNKIIQNIPLFTAKYTKNGDTTACIYPTPFGEKADSIYWLYDRNTGNQVFFAVSKLWADRIEDTGIGEPYELIAWIEGEVMPYCVDNTDWSSCHRYRIDYTDKAFDRDDKGRFTGTFDMGCDGSHCHCEPFGNGDYTWGLAEESELSI